MNNTSTEKRLKGALESLPWLLQSKGIDSSTSGWRSFRLKKNYWSDDSTVQIMKIEGIHSKIICFDIGEAGIQGELESPFIEGAVTT